MYLISDVDAGLLNMLNFKKPLAAAIKPAPTDNFHTSHANVFPQNSYHHKSGTFLHHFTVLTRRSVAPAQKFVRPSLQGM